MVESDGIKTQFGALKLQKKVLIVDGYFSGSPWYPDGWQLVSVLSFKHKTIHPCPPVHNKMWWQRFVGPLCFKVSSAKEYSFHIYISTYISQVTFLCM